MKITELQAEAKIRSQFDALDLIANQIIWMLEQVRKIDNPSAQKEMGLRFFQLYKDFKKIQRDGEKLVQEFQSSEFENPILEIIYRNTAELFVNLSNEGIFRQFTSIAETGELPDEEHNHD